MATTFTLTQYGSADARGRRPFTVEWLGQDHNGKPCRRAQHYFMVPSDFVAMEETKGNTVEVAP